MLDDWKEVWNPGVIKDCNHVTYSAGGLSHTHTHTHSHTHTHTHTHTHMLGFHVLWGLSIDVMFFILYKLYILSPYTAPIPKPNHHRRHSAILHFQKTSLSLIYKLVSSWGPKNVPTRTRILDIAIVVGTFCPHNVGYTWTTHTHTPSHKHTHSHTHTHTHTHTHSHTHTHTHTSLKRELINK